jgi:hypothetical protein
VGFPDWGKGHAAKLFDGRDTSTYVDREFRGAMAAHGIVSINTLKDDSDKRGPGYPAATPYTLLEIEQPVHQATHFSWITSGSGEDSWTNVKAAIQNNPNAVPTDCPTQFQGCRI